MADEVAYWERHPDGTLKGYDASGNLIRTASGGGTTGEGRREGGLDVHGGGADVYTIHTDPQTGQTYRSRETDSNMSLGPWEYGDGSRKSDRKRQKALRQARVDYYGREGTEALGAIDDPWNDLEGEIPTYEDLMGDEYVSSLSEAEADPMAVAAQRAALQRMGQVARTGYTAEDRAVEQQARSNAAQFERQQRDAIMQQAATRGMQGAGTTLGAQLSAQQSGANRNSQASLDMAANAQRRALQALQMQNSAAGQMRGQSFGEDSTRRSAADEANRYMIDGQRSASRDRFGMQGQVAQGQSQASAEQADRYMGYKHDAAAQKTKGEKAGEYTTESVESIAGFF